MFASHIRFSKRIVLVLSHNKMMPKRSELPPMGSLAAFESAFRHRSFVAAADELSLTPAAISHHIRLMESWVGRTLFERRPNAVLLTQSGQELGLQVQALLEGALALGPRIRRREESRRVVIRCQRSLAAKWLAPLVASFSQRNQGYEIILRAEPATVDPLSGRADMAIYYPRAGAVDPGIPLVGGRYVVVAAPSFLKRAGASRLEASRFDEAELIQCSAKDRGWPEPTWANWCISAALPGTLPAPRLTASLMHMVIELCVAGGGYAFVHEPLVKAELQDGRLCLASNVSVRVSHTYALMIRQSASNREEVRSLRRWLIHHEVI